MLQSRRDFFRLALRGAGFTVCLPVLQSVLPRTARAAGRSPKRLVVYSFPNGRHKNYWQPAQTGTAYTMPSVMAPLKNLHADMSVLSGLSNVAALQSDGVGDHAKATSTVMTGVPIVGYNSLHAVSMDQRLVQAWSPATPIASLQWGCGQPNTCDAAAPCVDTQVLSWSGPQTPLAPICDAQSAFNQLFGDNDPSLTVAQRAQLKQSKRSMLDFVLQDASSLRNKANPADVAKLDEYLTGVRALERQLDATVQSTCVPGSAPAQTLSYPEQVQAFNDLMVMALQCDQTRVITFMIEFGLSNRSHPHPAINAPIGHHALSHYGADPAELQQLLRVETWQVQQAANLAEKLKSTLDTDGSTLLDNTAMLILPSMGTGAFHVHDDMCVALLGRAGGTLHPGTHRNFNKATPIANLHVGLLQALGANVDKLGTTSTGSIDSL